jgi:hypothetical protein
VRIVLLAVSLASVLAVYGDTTGFGFHYDDYHFARPWTAAEVGSTFAGSWDPSRIESPFYRPLTASWYALRFEIFGLNAFAQRVVTLIGLTAAVWMLGLFVWRESRQRWTAVAATALYGIHPAMPYAQGMWLTNQMHVLASLTVLSALLIWQRARALGPLAWAPIAVLQIIAFGFKEDTLALTPLVLTLTFVRSRLVGDIPAPGPMVIGGGVLLMGALPALRYELLGRLGGYGVPGWEQGWNNFRRGLDGVMRLVPARRPWQSIASAVSTGVLLGGAVCSFRRQSAGRYLFVAGLLTAIFFNLPFVLVSKAEQMHLVAMGIVIALAGGIQAIVESVPRGFVRHGVAALVAAGLLTLLPLARHIAGDFAPCSSQTFRTDALAADWWIVPDEIQAWLRVKPDACKTATPAPLIEALETITWAYGFQKDELGRTVQWTSERAVILSAPRTSRLIIAVRQPGLPPGEPVTVTVRGPSGDVKTKLMTPDWRVLTVPLAPTWRSWLQGMHRIDLDISPTFVPAERDRSNQDRRPLGVELRIIEAK